MLLLSLLACNPPMPGEAAALCEPQGTEVGTCAPEFSGVDRDGEVWRLSELAEGNVVLLSFGATWCNYCAAMSKEAEPLWRARSDEGLMVIDVLVQDQDSNPAEAGDAAAWADNLGLSYPVLADPMGVSRPLYDPFAAMPASWLLDRDGVIQWAARGYVGADELGPKIEQVLTPPVEGAGDAVQDAIDDLGL